MTIQKVGMAGIDSAKAVLNAFNKAAQKTGVANTRVVDMTAAKSAKLLRATADEVLTNFGVPKKDIPTMSVIEQYIKSGKAFAEASNDYAKEVSVVTGGPKAVYTKKGKLTSAAKEAQSKYLAEFGLPPQATFSEVLAAALDKLKEGASKLFGSMGK